MARTGIVIGMGIGGISSAIQAGQLENQDGTPYFDKLYVAEALPEPYMGTSLRAARGHLVGEYPFADDNYRTIRSCLVGSLHARQMINPLDFVTAESPMVFALAKGSQHKPKHALEPLSESQTQDVFLTNLDVGQRMYANYFEELASAYGPEKAAEMFFGWPDKMYEILAPKDYEQFLPAASIAVQTQEYGFDIVRLGHYLVRRLEELSHRGHVEILTSHEVIGAEKKDKGFKLTCSNGKVLEADVVINASWQNFYTLDAQIAPEYMKNLEVNVYARGMAHIDISKMPPHHPSYFMLLGSLGGMDASFNRNEAFLYLPGELVDGQQGAYLGQTKLSSIQPALPKDFLELLAMPKERRLEIAQGFLQVQQAKFPYLNQATAIDLKISPTLTIQRTSNQDRLEERPREQILQPTNGWFSVVPTKATYFATMSLDVTRRVVGQFKERGEELPRDFSLPLEGEIGIVLPPSVSMKKDQERFGTKRGFGSHFSVSNPAMRDRPVPTWSTTVRAPKLYEYQEGDLQLLDAAIDHLTATGKEVRLLMDTLKQRHTETTPDDAEKLSDEFMMPFFGKPLFRLGLAMQEIATRIKKDAKTTGIPFSPQQLERLQETIDSEVQKINSPLITSLSLTNNRMSLISSRELGVIEPSIVPKLEGTGNYTLVLSSRGYANDVYYQPDKLFVAPKIVTGSTSLTNIVSFGMGAHSPRDTFLSAIVGGFSVKSLLDAARTHIKNRQKDDSPNIL